MAGRPKLMAKRVGELEACAVELSGETFLACPQQYIEKPTNDPICMQWNAAVAACGPVNGQLLYFEDS
jgi:hypothetical protein